MAREILLTQSVSSGGKTRNVLRAPPLVCGGSNFRNGKERGFRWTEGLPEGGTNINTLETFRL